MNEEVGFRYCPKIGITLRIPPIDGQILVNRQQCRPSHAYQYTFRFSLVYITISFFQASTVLSTVRFYVFKSPGMWTGPGIACLQQCHKHPVPWWDHPSLAQLTLPGALATLLHPQELSSGYIHRNGKGASPLRQSQATMSRCWVHRSMWVPVLAQHLLRPPSSCMKASCPERGLMSQPWWRCKLGRQCQATCLGSSTTVTPAPSTTLSDHAAILVYYRPGLMGIHLLGHVLGRGSWEASRVHFESHCHPMLPQLLLCRAHGHPLSLHHGGLPPLLCMRAKSNGQFLYIKTSQQCTWPTHLDIKLANSSGALLSDSNTCSHSCSVASSSFAPSFWSWK